ncbi:MAG: AbrB/MazE/SpoVT family DNA-binding domain-containing protein [Promethearchaeota archaeon]
MNTKNLNIEIKEMNSKHPKHGKYFFGTVKVGKRGQIVIPITARKIFKILPGDQILVFGDTKKGLGLVKASFLSKLIPKVMPDFNLDEINVEEAINEGGE